MATNKQKLEAALAAIDTMTDAEYLALHEEAKRYDGPEIVVLDFNTEPETHLNFTTFVSTVNSWVESGGNIRLPGDAAYVADAEMPLVA